MRNVTQNVPLLILVGVLGAFGLVSVFNFGPDTVRQTYSTHMQRQTITGATEVAARSKMMMQPETVSTAINGVPTRAYPPNVGLTLRYFSKSNQIYQYLPQIVAFNIFKPLITADENIAPSLPRAVLHSKALLLQSIFTDQVTNQQGLSSAMNASFPEIIADCPSTATAIANYNGVQVTQNVTNQLVQQINVIVQQLLPHIQEPSAQAIFDNVVRVAEALRNILMDTVQTRYMDILGSCYTR